jgi:hypothetical protein
MQMKGGFRVRSNGQPVAQSSKETAAQDITPRWKYLFRPLHIATQRRRRDSRYRREIRR